MGAHWKSLGSALNALSTASTFTLAYVFPDGRFVPGWLRWPWLISMVLNVIATFARGPAWDAWVDRSPMLAFGLGFLIAVQIVLLVAAPLLRYRRVASSIQRQQLKWVLLALIAQPIFWPIGAFGIPALFPAALQTLAGALVYNLLRQIIQDFAFLLVPITIGLAILRYRLWDIDVIIRRTLIYSALSAVLALTYFGCVLVLESVFRFFTGQGQNSLVVVLSTLAIAALFGPLRARVQRAIDRRFFRSKYDATRTLAAFAMAARDEVDLDRLSTQLVDVVEHSLQPEEVSLWLRPNPRGMLSRPAAYGREQP
jgi:hypothetical protein